MTDSSSTRTRRSRGALPWLLGTALAVALGLIAARISPIAPNRGPAADISSEQKPQFDSLRGFHYASSMLWGKVDKELYPPLVDPSYVAAEQADWFLRRDDRVLVVDRPEGPYVYPEYILATHHVVNETFGGEKVAITSCVLSGSCSIYSREVDGRALTIGVSAQLYGGNAVLFDRETDTRWLQLTGQALRGPLGGQRLRPVTTGRVRVWDEIRELPGAKVLAPLHGIEFYRRFHRGISQERMGSQVVASQRRLDPRLDPYTRGVGLVVRGKSRFYPRKRVERAGVVNDVVDGWSVLVLVEPASRSCRVLRRFHQGRILEFDLENGKLVDRQTASCWSLEGRCVAGPMRGERLERPWHTAAFWFSWAALYPETDVATL